MGGSFAFPLVSVTGSSCDAGHLCSWSGGTATDWQANRAQGTVQSFYFANRFHDHLRVARLRCGGGCVRGCRPARAEHVRRGEFRTGLGAHQQRLDVHAAGRLLAIDADVPAAQSELPQRELGRRRGDPLPRVHARSFEPARDRCGRGWRAVLAAGRGDGGGVERLVRAGLPRRPVPGAGHGGVGRDRHGRVLALRGRRRPAADGADRLPDGRCRPDPLPWTAGARERRLHVR